MTSLPGIVIGASGLDLMAVTPYDCAHWGRAVLADPGKRIVVSERNVFETSSYINLRLFDVNVPQKKSSNRNGTLCLFPEELVDSEV
jgi:hypothetical protein